MRRQRRHRRCPTNSIFCKNNMHVSHVHSQPCLSLCLPYVPRGPVPSKENRFVFKNAISADTDVAQDPEEGLLPRDAHVPRAVAQGSLCSVPLEEESLDPGKLQQVEANLSLRHKLILAQPGLRKSYRLRPPVQLAGPEMEAIHPVIAKAFQGRPTDVVEPGKAFTLADTVGHFWEPNDFRDLPLALREVLDETFKEEEREIAYVLKHQSPSGAKLSEAGARQLGVSSDRAKAWESGSALPFKSTPPQFARKPYSSVYTNLATLILVCAEILRLLKLGKAMPWKRVPWILSPPAIIVKTSPFEADGMKKRIVYDCTASGVNPHLEEHREMSLPTILRLLQSMGKNYFMAKSDLKDMFYNFPVRQADWTFLGFSHPVTGQYMVVPFYAMGLGCAPPHCQEFAESVRDIIRQEAERRRLGLCSLPGLETVPRTAADAGGLAAAESVQAFATEVYIDDFQHLTQLLQQGLELFEIGARVYEILGLIEKVVKREGPARVMTLLGFEFNSTTGVLRIPDAKAQEIRLLIRQILDTAEKGGSVPWSILSSAHGKLMWAATGIELGRSYLSAIRRPLDAVATLLTNRMQRANFLIPVFEMLEMVNQLRWWDAAVSCNNGTTQLYLNSAGMYDRWTWSGSFGDDVPSDVVQGFTDACPRGGGWLWGSERFRFLWSARERRHHINVLEAETILRMLRADASSLERCKVLMWCDNMVTVKAVRKGTSKSPILTKIVREIRLICMHRRISLCVHHIAGVKNPVADGLSRGLVAARCESWSLNKAIMCRWRSAYQGFDMDAFCDPSGRGQQAPSYCSIADEPFEKSFAGLKVFAFPPLHLVGKFLQSSLNWGADILVAVLPVQVAQELGLQEYLLYSYGSFQGIFTRPQGSHTGPCPAMGFAMGVYELSARA